jgi:hypothetical protein
MSLLQSAFHAMLFVICGISSALHERGIVLYGDPQSGARAETADVPARPVLKAVEVSTTYLAADNHQYSPPRQRGRRERTHKVTPVGLGCILLYVCTKNHDSCYWLLMNGGKWMCYAAYRGLP